MNSKSIKKGFITVIKVAILLLIFSYLVGPFLVIVSNSFKTGSEINRIIPTLIPEKATFENFKELFTDKVFIQNIVNSIKIGLITMIVAIIIAIPSAYAMVRVKSRGTAFLQVWILLSQMIPGITVVVPLYMILRTMQLTNNHAGLIIVYAVWSLPFSIWMLRGFIGGVHQDLEDAAFIDGCGLPKMFFFIILPTILPGVLTTGVFAFINAWNELFFALCLMKSQQLQTLPIKLNSYIGLAGQARDGMVAAGSLVSSIPGLIVFLVFQRYFVSGLTSGSIK